MAPQITFLGDIADQLTASYLAAGRSPKTVESYTATIRQFSAFVIAKHGSDDPDDITSTMVEEYIGWQRTTCSAGTAKVRFSSLRASWRWMMKRGFATTDVFAGIPAPTVDVKMLSVLTDEDVKAILATTDGHSFLNRRDRAIFLILADTGCRRHDVASLALADTDLVTGRVTFRQTKANRDRIAALSPTTVLAVKRWLKERERVSSGTTPTTLFTTRSGSALTGDGMYQAVARRYVEAGVSVERAMHSFRSWAAISMLDRGAGESEVMALLGWRSTVMLNRYQRGRQVDRALARHSGFSPVSGL